MQKNQSTEIPKEHMIEFLRNNWLDVYVAEMESVFGALLLRVGRPPAWVQDSIIREEITESFGNITNWVGDFNDASVSFMRISELTEKFNSSMQSATQELYLEWIRIFLDGDIYGETKDGRRTNPRKAHGTASCLPEQNGG